MALRLYRRHRNDCEAHRPEGSFTGEFEEGRKGWRRCACLIHASGTLSGKFNRRQTGKSRWEEARAMSAEWELAGSWDGSIQPVPPPPAPQPEVAAQAPRMEIVEASEAYLAKCKNRNIAPTTLAKYQTFTNQLRAYAQSRGYVYLDQLTVADMDRFYGSWKDGIRSKAKKLERLKSFVKFCLKREWLQKNIADDLEAPEGSSITVPKAPFTDEELNRIFTACDAIGMDGFRPNRRNWIGEDVKDFILLSIYTGMRISDVATFDIAKRLSGNSVFLRMHKTRKPLYTWIPDWLVVRLRARQHKHGSLIFRCGVTHNMKQLTDIWRNKRLHKVFELAGPFEEKATPHRFRHTFVRILLEKGVPVPDVAELIGDTEEIVRKHYSRWIASRQDRLTRILQDAFADKPTPKVIPINRGS